MKRLLIILVKIGISVAILAVLFNGAQESLSDLRNQPKDWSLLALATLVGLGAVCASFVRWYWLVRALDLPFTMRDAFRLGFVGYLFNFVSLGSVGGDLFKAVFVAREQPGRRAEAVATVVIDRMIGLYSVFLVASAAILWTGSLFSPEPEIRLICQITVGSTVAGTIAVVIVLTPDISRGRLSRALAGLPKVGPVAVRLLTAVRIYSERKYVLLASLLISFVIHGLSTGSYFLIAMALPGNAPTLADHCLIVPLGIVAGATPLPLGGLGATEALVEFMYTHVPTPEPVPAGAGLLVCLTYRGVTILIALIGAVYYAANRAMMAQAVRNQAAREQQRPTATPAASNISLSASDETQEDLLEEPADASLSSVR